MAGPERPSTIDPPKSEPRIDPTVFWVSVVVTILFVLWGVIGTASLATAVDASFNFVTANLGWLFILGSGVFVVLAVALAVSRYGRIRLGTDDDRPEFRTTSWIAMMFSAGMGIGLMFFGVAEPMSHFGTPPMDLVEAGTENAAALSMQYSYFHWAFHPWAMYAVVGLSLAYFTFRKGRPNLVSSAFFPLIGERANGGTGKAIDTLAIFATLFGSATSLGLGALQINSGLNILWNVPQSEWWAIGIIVVLTIAFVFSAVTGVRRGIQYLSNINMVLAIVLLFFLFVVGPTVFILNTFTTSVGNYLFDFIPMSFRTGAFGGSDWLGGWTIFYWAWWISWTPFVGTFIARISKGRTIREFVVGVILVPSIVSFVWFAVLGGSALRLQLDGVVDLAALAAESQEAALFGLLEQFPLFVVTAIITIVLVALFFVSGADAGSVVMGMLSSRGTLEPQRIVVILWGGLTGAVAAVLLLAGGLGALQTLAILAALPFLLVIFGLCLGLLKELRNEPPAATLSPIVQQHVRHAIHPEIPEPEPHDRDAVIAQRDSTDKLPTGPSS